MLMVAIALVMSIVVTNVYARKDSSQHVPRWCIAVVPRFHLSRSGNAIRRGTVKNVSKYGAEEWPDFDRQRHKTSPECNEEWKAVAKFLDRVCFWVYVALTLVLLVALLAQIL